MGPDNEEIEPKDLSEQMVCLLMESINDKEPDGSRSEDAKDMMIDHQIEQDRENSIQMAELEAPEEPV